MTKGIRKTARAAMVAHAAPTSSKARNVQGFGDGGTPREDGRRFSRAVAEQDRQHEIQRVRTHEDRHRRLARSERTLDAGQLQQQEDGEASSHDHAQVLDGEVGDSAFGTDDVADDGTGEDEAGHTKPDG